MFLVRLLKMLESISSDNNTNNVHRPVEMKSSLFDQWQPAEGAADKIHITSSVVNAASSIYSAYPNGA